MKPLILAAALLLPVPAMAQERDAAPLDRLAEVADKIREWIGEKVENLKAFVAAIASQVRQRIDLAEERLHKRFDGIGDRIGRMWWSTLGAVTLTACVVGCFWVWVNRRRA